MIFDPRDHPKLIGDPALFAAVPGASSYQRNVTRTAVALEITAQLVRRGAEIHPRGGTHLQGVLGWPPLRASLDNDQITLNATQLYADLEAVVQEFTPSSGWALRRRPAGAIPGFKADVVIPNGGSPLLVRVDALEVTRLPTRTITWRMPGPWNGFRVPNMATLEAQAAAKLLLTAEPPFGRTVAVPANDRGRKSRIKDLFDLACLGQQPLDAAIVRAAVQDEVARKSQYLGQTYTLPAIVEEAVNGARMFLTRKGLQATTAPLWRAHGQVRGAIRAPFTELDLRFAAGCTQHALLSLPGLDWADSWLPYTNRAGQRRTTAPRQWPPGAAFTGPDAGLAGLEEAWALP